MRTSVLVMVRYPLWNAGWPSIATTPGCSPQPNTMRARTAGSTPPERGLPQALVEERRHAGFGVVGAEDVGEEIVLDVETTREARLEAVVDRPLGERERHRRPAGQLAGQRERLVEDVGRRHHPVDQADAQRLVGRHLATREDEVLGARWAHQTGETLRGAPARDDAEQDLRLAELRVVRGDAQVARERELAPAAERVAVDRGD